MKVDKELNNILIEYESYSEYFIEFNQKIISNLFSLASKEIDEIRSKYLLRKILINADGIKFECPSRYYNFCIGDFNVMIQKF